MTSLLSLQLVGLFIETCLLYCIFILPCVSFLNAFYVLCSNSGCRWISRFMRVMGKTEDIIVLALFNICQQMQLNVCVMV